MNKIILIITLCICNAFALNCLNANFNSPELLFKYGYILDSITYINGSIHSDPSEEDDVWYRTSRYSWNEDGTIINVVTSLSGKTDTLMTDSILVEYTGNTVHTLYFNDENFNNKDVTYTVFNDSIFGTGTIRYEEEIQRTISMWIHNDTLYQCTNDTVCTIMTMNPQNENECFIAEPDSFLVKSLYELTENGFIITSFDKYNRIWEKSYFHKIGSENTTSIIRKIRPANIKKIRYFDLLGRQSSKEKFLP
ncbi:MAG: hypothetical protein HUK21_04300 [Fibrobacteraceae bacterium]|nr:hypothetical protein [Fibrobacteraceae bacterium]